MKNLSSLTFLSIMGFIFLIPLKSVLAENLLIVEVQIIGEKASNDYVRIYNPSSRNLDISGFKLRKRSPAGKESSIRVFPSGSKIPAKSYFFWANSKENYHLSVGANVWSTATLSKNNSVALFNRDGKILDALSWGESQNSFKENQSFPENPNPNQKLERKQIAGTYQDANNNSQDFYLNSPPEPSQPFKKELDRLKTQPNAEIEPVEVRPQQSQLNTYPLGVFINEILPSPEGPDEKEEWIEIFNQNNSEVDLSEWQITDTVGRVKTYNFPRGTKISAQGFLVLERPISKITLNNDGDGLKFVQPSGNIADTVSYEKALRGQSYNRIDSDWVWSATLTPDLENIVPAQKTEASEALEEAGKTDINVAPLKDLVKIVHIGKIRAEELISLRPFYSLDDLTRIKGIGEKALEDIKNQGLAWVDPKLEPPKHEKEIESSEKGLAAVAKPLKQEGSAGEFPKSPFIFLIALVVAIFSGTIILVLKKKLKAITAK